MRTTTDREVVDQFLASLRDNIQTMKTMLSLGLGSQGGIDLTQKLVDVAEAASNADPSDDFVLERVHRALREYRESWRQLAELGIAAWANLDYIDSIVQELWDMTEEVP